jgi:hypothetical protein
MPVGAMRIVAGSALVGVASGLRSTAGVGMVVLRGGPRLPDRLHRRGARRAATTAVGVELVLDKMPFTGSRLEPPGLIARVGFAGLAAGLLAQAGGRDRAGGPRHQHRPQRGRASDRPMAAAAVTAAAVGVAGAAALVAAKAGHDWRAALAKERPDAAIAVVEDAIAVGMAAAGVALATAG